jgi:cation:H+ antiporter
LSWLGFIVCAAAIIMCSIKLGLYGDLLSQRTKLGGAWIGLMLLGAATSLPELVTTITATVIQKAPNMAVGNVLGSNCFNVFALAIIDLFLVRNFTRPKPDGSNIIAGAYAIILTTLLAVGIVLNELPAVAGVGVVSLVIFAVYLFSARNMFVLDQRIESERPGGGKPIEGAPDDLTVSQIGWRMLGMSALVIFAGTFTTHFANQIAIETGWGEAFAGNLLLAVATSLPELAVTTTAIRIGAVGMGIGNILGSCVFNPSIIFITDLVYRDGSIFAHIDEKSHLITALEANVLIAIVVISLVYRPKYKIVSIEGLIVSFIYIGGLYLLLP